MCCITPSSSTASRSCSSTGAGSGTAFCPRGCYSPRGTQDWAEHPVWSWDYTGISGGNCSLAGFGRYFRPLVQLQGSQLLHVSAVFSILSCWCFPGKCVTSFPGADLTIIPWKANRDDRSPQALHPTIAPLTSVSAQHEDLAWRKHLVQQGRVLCRERNYLKCNIYYTPSQQYRSRSLWNPSCWKDTLPHFVSTDPQNCNLSWAYPHSVLLFAVPWWDLAAADAVLGQSLPGTAWWGSWSTLCSVLAWLPGDS